MVKTSANCRLRVVAFAAAIIGVSGCFASQKPLIAEGQAEFPLPTGATVVEQANCDAPGAKILGCTGYRRLGSETLTVEDGAYVLHPTPGDAPTPAGDLAAGPPPHIRLKAIGEGLYIAQMDAPDPTSTTGAMRYVYELVRLTGDAALLYLMDCEANGDQAYVKSGALAAITNDLMGPSCAPASIAGLSQVFRDRLANGKLPDKRLDFQK
jgi:hypothetical protein